ncbi:MAG: nuclear transport factor 2 family protein [Ekhidna sp.]|nr:nuclear transport factor 2 family protein [Ekhidna sp.]MBC6409742.1 nuclear transport factor 2 family protein [Ekhidna sp.]
MKSFGTLLLIFSINSLFSQPSEESAIRQVLSDQLECWNEGDLNCFMEGYWKSENLVFIGSKGVTYGWEEVLLNYQKGYPNKEMMGELAFNLISLEPLSEDFWSVIGKWSLKRKKENPSGYFTLLFRRFGNEWLIVSDHSS